METRKCDFCGRKYTAKTKRSKYCCDRCRYLAFEGKKTWRLSAPPEFLGESRSVPSLVTADEIAAAVSQLKGAAATLDAAALYGPKETREFCRIVSDGVLESVRRFGL